MQGKLASRIFTIRTIDTECNIDLIEIGTEGYGLNVIEGFLFYESEEK